MIGLQESRIFAISFVGLFFKVSQKTEAHLRNVGHTVYLGLLLSAGLLFTFAFGVHGLDYYRTPLQERPYHPLYESLKPSGFQVMAPIGSPPSTSMVSALNSTMAPSSAVRMPRPKGK